MIQGYIDRGTEANLLATNEVNGWSAATRKETTCNFSGDYLWKRSNALVTLSGIVSDGQRHIDAQERELRMALEKLQDQRKRLNETLLIYPEPAMCHTELVQSSSQEYDADFKEEWSRQTVFNVDEGWDYRSRIPVCTTWFRNGRHAIKHINHTP